MASGFSIGKFFYWLRYRIGEFLLRGFVRIFPWAPRRVTMFVTRLASRVTFVALWRYRKRMERNITAGLGGALLTGEHKRLARAAWDNFARAVHDTIVAVHSPVEAIRASIVVKGEEHLQRAVTRGRGVIALSAHLGNFTLIGARLAAAGYPFSVVVKHPRDPGVARLMDHYRAVLGLKTIAAKPRREAARQVLKALRRNEVVLIIADEFKKSGVEVEFLGRLAAAPRGPVTLALRSGAAVVPMFVARDGQDRLTLHIWPEIDLVRSGEVQDDVASNVVLFTRQLEAMVRRYPEQWNWMGFHRNGRTPRAQMRRPHPADPDQSRAAATESK